MLISLMCKKWLLSDRCGWWAPGENGSLIFHTNHQCLDLKQGAAFLQVRLASGFGSKCFDLTAKALQLIAEFRGQADQIIRGQSTGIGQRPNHG